MDIGLFSFHLPNNKEEPARRLALPKNNTDKKIGISTDPCLFYPKAETAASSTTEVGLGCFCNLLAAVAKMILKNLRAGKKLGIAGWQLAFERRSV